MNKLIPMTIELLSEQELNKNLQQEVTALYKQLNATGDQLPLKQVLAPENNVFVAVCRIDDRLVGVALLAMYRVISGYRGLVEDVVVDSAHRGKGIGRKLMEKLLKEAKTNNLDEILLFTGHHRLPAINLYKSLGFTLRKSGIYNLKIEVI